MSGYLAVFSANGDVMNTQELQVRGVFIGLNCWNEFLVAFLSTVFLGRGPKFSVGRCFSILIMLRKN